MNDSKQPLCVAAELLKKGGVVIYPTETLYALGANGLDHGAVHKVAEIKGRSPGKPLPLIISGLEQLQLVTSWDNEVFLRLAELFWPGPLSILVPAAAGLSPLVADRDGWTSVRQSSNDVAQALARTAEVPLVATSANLSGHSPVERLDMIDPRLAEKADFVLHSRPYPRGGLPSTVVRIVGTNHVRLVRQGAVSADDLTARGFEISED